MRGKQSKLLRKARRVALTPLERETHSKLAKARTERDKNLAAVNVRHREGVENLNEARVQVRKEIHAEFEQKRAQILKEHEKLVSEAA